MTRKPQKYYPIKLGILFTTVLLLILVSLTSFWLQRTIYNTERFTTITTEVLNEESSRQSIGQLVTNQIFEDKPILKSLLSERLTGHITNLLGTQAAQTSIERLARESQLLVTSPRKDPVVLQLSSIKSAIVSIQETIGRTGDDARFDANNIPDEITIIDTARLPNIHRYSIIVLWLGPLALVLAIMLLAWWVYRGGKTIAIKRTQIGLIVIGLSALIALAIGPLTESLIISTGQDAPSQTLLHNLYMGFMAPFRSQALLLAGISALALIILTIWYKIIRIYSIRVVVTKKKASLK